MFGLYRSIVLSVPLGTAEISSAGALPGLPDMEIHEREPGRTTNAIVGRKISLARGG
jgi:hypothetical protein